VELKNLVVTALAFFSCFILIIIVTLVLYAPAPHPPSSVECTADPQQTVIQLPSPNYSGLTVEEAIKARRSVRSYSNESISLQELSELLFAAQGITDSEMGFRAAPSAGALYPLTIYIQPNRVEGVSCGIYRYEPSTHSLYLAKEGNYSRAVFEAAGSQAWVYDAAAVIIFTANYSKTEAKYGSDAERYILMETGHASENLLLEAASLGLAAVPVGGINQQAFNELLNLTPAQKTLYINCVGKKR